MPSLSQHQSNDFVKLLLLGDAKSGKTGSLVSLVKAGFKLRVLDMDNLLDVLKHYIIQECPENIDNVEFRSLRDKYKQSPLGTIVDGQPKAWLESISMLNRWKYKEGDQEYDFGTPGTWDPNTILVIDSLSRWCDAALAFHQAMNPNPDKRSDYWEAQKDVEKQLASLTSKNFMCSVIVICHGTYTDLEDGTRKIFPQSVGSALSPKIPQYFPNYIRYKNVGGTRSITTVSDPMIDLAVAKPLPKGTYPISTGLAEIFAALRSGEATKKEEPTAKKTVISKPTIVQKRV